MLDCLGGDLRHVGENVAAAAVLDMAFLTYELCNYLAALHGALVCEAEGVGLDLLAAMFDAEVPDLVASLLDRAVAAGHGEQDVAAVIEVLRR